MRDARRVEPFDARLRQIEALVVFRDDRIGRDGLPQFRHRVHTARHDRIRKHRPVGVSSRGRFGWSLYHRLQGRRRDVRIVHLGRDAIYQAQGDAGRSDGCGDQRQPGQKPAPGGGFLTATT
jgi:hypothetical protein